jgi:hypothetical protein
MLDGAAPPTPPRNGMPVGATRYPSICTSPANPISHYRMNRLIRRMLM